LALISAGGARHKCSTYGEQARWGSWWGPVPGLLPNEEPCLNRVSERWDPSTSPTEAGCSCSDRLARGWHAMPGWRRRSRSAFVEPSGEARAADGHGTTVSLKRGCRNRAMMFSSGRCGRDKGGAGAAPNPHVAAGRFTGALASATGCTVRRPMPGRLGRRRAPWAEGSVRQKGGRRRAAKPSGRPLVSRQGEPFEGDLDAAAVRRATRPTARGRMEGGGRRRDAGTGAIRVAFRRRVEFWLQRRDSLHRQDELTKRDGGGVGRDRLFALSPGRLHRQLAPGLAR